MSISGNKTDVLSQQKFQNEAGSHQLVLVDVPGDLSDEDLAAFARRRTSPVGRGATEKTEGIIR